MRQYVALGFLGLASMALVMKLWSQPAPLHPLTSFYDYVPNYRAPLMVQTPKQPFAHLSMVKPTTEVESSVPSASAERQVSILIAGDTGLNGSFQPVHAGFGLKHGARTAFSDATPHVAPLINADVNIANLETVVTDHNNSTASLKLFGFRTHPDAVRELMRIGFNVFSTANNHSMDYGLDGARETMKHLRALGVVHAGMGENRHDAMSAKLIERKGVRFAFGALGIGGSGFGSLHSGEMRPGQLTVTERDLSDVATSLRDSQADYRVMSVHYGTEFDVTTSSSDRARFARVISSGVDMVIGHHHHVAAGIELVNGAPVFYGLGNFLHWGTQDMGRHDMCHDYGLVARVHLAGKEGEKLAVKAIEAIPVTEMHIKPRRLGAIASAERVQAINYLNRQFGENGVRFAVEADGTGLYCAPGADSLRDEIGARCASGAAYVPPSPALEARIATACARRVVRIVEEEQSPPEIMQLGLASTNALN